MLTSKWIEKETIPVSEEIQEHFRNPWIQQLFARNKIQTVADAKKFLDPDHYVPTPSKELPDLEIAAKRLIKAIETHEKIGIWGDFDVDGQTATTVLYEGLSKLGADVIYYIPIRAKESHGIKLSSLIEFLKNDIAILLTCDTGISEIESIDYATRLGIDVLVTDHHSLPLVLPNAMAIVNPQRLPEDHPLRTLSGVGVAYKLIEYLYQFFDMGDQSTDLLDLVAMGTVADVAILKGENRFLVQNGLKLLQYPKRVGLQEIYKNKKFINGNITEMHIGFYLAPLLNALGRLSDANPMVDFLTTQDLQKAKVFSIQLENINEKRKLITEQITSAIISKFEQRKELLNEPSIIMHHPDWEAGVLGIVANRLVEMYQKPTLLLTGNEKTGYFGSARSIENLNIIQAIQANSRFLNHFGGHAMAAGVSLSSENYMEFRNNFNKTILETIGDSILQKELLIDGYINFDLIDLQFVKELESFAPFGAGNPAPIFASKSVVFEKLRPVGKKSEHLKITASDNHENIQDLIWWRANFEQIPDDKVDVAYILHSSNYLGKESVQIEVVAIQPGEEILKEIQSSKDMLSIMDYRKDQPQGMDWVKNYANFIWFQEGLAKSFSPSHHRLNMIPAETLILFTIPPNLTELQKILLTIRPKTLVLFGNSPFDYSINNTIITIAGMLKHIVSTRQGLFQPIEIATAIGHRVSTIEAICHYLHAEGQITIIEHPDTQWFIKLGGSKIPEKSHLYKKNAEFFHRETIAFHKWFADIDINYLKNSLLDFQ